VGSLIPDQPLIYERANGVTYARYRDPPYNKQPRWVVGEMLDSPKWKNDRLWNDIREAAKTNKVLQEALERVIMLYHLSEKDNNG